MKFRPGSIVGTAAIVNDLTEDQIHVLLDRHFTGDWGDLCSEDKFLNECAVNEGERILSAYDGYDKKIYIVTEADRSVTTILYAEEY